MSRRLIAAGFVVLIVLAVSTSASATPVERYVLFKNGHAYCTAFEWTRGDGFVGCSARIRGAWQTVLLRRTGRPVRSHQVAAPANTSAFQLLRTHWRGGPFLCTVATDGVICVSSGSAHGFGINGRGITTK